MPFSVHPCTLYDVISVKLMPPSSRKHPQLYCVKMWSQSNQLFQSYWWFCTPPVAVQIHTAKNVYLFQFVCFTRYVTHGLPGTSSCTTSYIQLGCQWPDVRVSHIQVPAWDLNQNLQDQGWGKTWLSACILGKEGYATMDRWVPADNVHKKDPAKFLDYIESMLDDEISPWVHVYKLEDITKRSDKSIDELVNQICQLTQRAQISNGSNAAIEFEVQCRLIWVIPEANIELHKQLLKVSHDKRVSHLLEICRTYHAVESGVAAMCAGHVVYAVCHAHLTHDPKLLTSNAPCPICTHQHPPGRNNCPAHDLACKCCGKKGHWWVKCQSCNTTSPQVCHHQPHFKNHEKGREPQAAKAKTEKRAPHKDLFIAAMDCGMVGDVHPKEMIIDNISSQQCNEVYTVIKLPASASSKGTASVCLKIDTRSGGNILPLCLFQQLHPKQTSPDGLLIGLDPVQTKLTTCNGSPIHLYGILCGPILWQPNTPWAQPHMIHSYWYIIGTPGPAPLGLPACEKLAVVQVNCAVKTTQPKRSPAGTTPTQAARAAKPPKARTSKSKCIQSTDDLARDFPDRFMGIGKYPGEYKIWLCPDAHPVMHALRKCLITLHPKVKEHLAKMEAMGVITHVDQPTDWVSSSTYVQKANGELCLCLDMHDLNRAICHDHHKMPMVEEVTHEFANLHYFTKLNTCHGYWSIVLDEESSLLTTFNSPFGRYCFLHLPFGLVCSQDIFQKKMEQFLEECPGCIWITNDITVHGCTEAEHDAHLHNLMQVGHKYGVVFNPQKMHVKAPAVNFFGCLYDANGLHPVLEKVDTVHALPAPTNVTKLQEFLSMVTYLSPFICGLPTLTAPLQELLRKDADFTWNASYETAFEQVKQAVVSDTTLRYFNPSLPVTIQVDASLVGLGTALLQNNKPVAFASKALTNAEHRYANIERDASCCLQSREILHFWSFMIESDHKLLESISRKNLADMPAWLQGMMLCLQGYDLTIHYWPGKEMVIPDTLSQFSPWPGLCLSWQHRETLTIKHGLVLWGEALIIPPAKRERFLNQLHQFHQGITKSQLLMHGSFFWPSINKAIKEVVHQCETCTQFQSQNTAVPLTPTPTPSHPVQVCATDIFTFEGIDHLVVGDFYSKMIFIWHIPLSHSNANKVVPLLKEMFA